MDSQLRFPLDSHVFGASKGGDSVPRGLPQLMAAKEIYTLPKERLNELKANDDMHKCVKHGNMADARKIFDSMPMRNIMSWNIMILGYAQQEESARALELYALMQEEGVQPDDRTFVGTLKACAGLAAREEAKRVGGKFEIIRCLAKGRAIHSQAVKHDFESNLFVGTTLVNMYVKCGCMVDASDVFNQLPHRNVVAWNTMILGYADLGGSAQALQLYGQMHQESVKLDTRTLVGALKACSSLAAPEEGKQGDEKFVKTLCLVKGRAIHSQGVKSALESDVFVGTALVDMYVKCGSMDDARCVFDRLPYRNVVTWTAMILGYAQQEDSAVALGLFAEMHLEGIQPDARIFVGALKSCSSLAELEKGKQIYEKLEEVRYLKKGRAIHSLVIKGGFELDIFVGTMLVDVYAKCGSMEDARCVFDRLPHRDEVAWNTMILGYAEQEDSAQALELYAWMHQDRCVLLDAQTFMGALKACSNLAALGEGKHGDGKLDNTEILAKGRAIHAQAIKGGFESDVFTGTALVNVYMKCGSTEDACRVFDEMPRCNVVTLNTMILGYAEVEDGTQALEWYAWMYEEGIQPDTRTFVGVLKACSSLASWEEGKQGEETLAKAGILAKARAIHSQLVKSGFELDIFVGATLVHSYVRCGSMQDAWCVFEDLPHHDVVTWNTMILGHAEQEESEVVFSLYSQMQEQGLSLNSSTFVSTLKACANAAALEIGRELHCQISRAGFETIAIVATGLIDMYGKCASMIDAHHLFDALPTRDAVTYTVLLAGYTRQGESELVFHLFEQMMQEVHIS